MGRIAPVQDRVQESQHIENPLNTSLLFDYNNDEKKQTETVDDDEAYFMQRMYDTTVDGPCQAMRCSIEDQLDLFTVRNESLEHTMD